MKRREFFGLSAWSLAALATGCARPPAMQARQMLTLDPKSGATLHNQKVSIPKGNRSTLDSAGHGFLLANGQSVLALDFAGQSCVIPGPDNGRWVRPDLLVTAEKTSSDIYRVCGVHFPDGRILWSQEMGYGQILGFDAQAVYVGHLKGVTCFELDGGKKRWENTEMNELKSWCVLPSSLVLGLGNAGRVCWLDLKNGKLVRSLTTTTTPNRVILVAGDDEYTLTLTRRIALAAFRPDQLKPVWVQPITAYDHQALLLGYANRIALVELHESSVAVDIVTGGTLWSDSLCTHISICQDVALLRRGRGDTGGRMSLVLEARQLRSGKSLWKRELEDIHAVTAVNGENFALLTT
ncbi:MAG: PQQ-binding-like beta-propeller repeat protein [Candidatus Eremiobacteraeota bacterium]|nr:PQQ-binding-like beta-propeller repeat protein [Candidatus Eremiobacteraeota bacterium]MCW5870886.1 PQQ-binding-like beta-propeller repeat protein [Candidatus Eremiobacteraeota bacterium]